MNFQFNWLRRKREPLFKDQAASDVIASDEVEEEVLEDEGDAGGAGELADLGGSGESGDFGDLGGGDDPPPGEAETVDSEEEEFPPRSLPPELHYLYQLIRYRIGRILRPDTPMAEPLMPAYRYWQLPIGKFIIDYNLANPPLTANDARLLLIAVVPHVQPDLFDHSINSMLKGESDFPLIGGSRGKNFRGFIPTGQTAIFLLAGDDWKRDLYFQELFWADHVFARNKLLWLGEVEAGEPLLSGRIILSQDYIDILVHDRVLSPHHSINFPAKLISTTRERKQLVINDQLTDDFNHVLDWVKHKKQVGKRWQDGKKGYRCLFHGPSGTGKTFATCMLGKEAKKEVYRIDLSLVVSKFIGETEKNLELIFARAENKDWILFFDEADALFGKRTNIRDAHDKYANQEASYLLQRIEDYDGLVVLATNMKNNIDESFLRRFDSDLKFSMPSMEERKEIWQNSFPKEVAFGREQVEKMGAADAGEARVVVQEKIFYRYGRRLKEELEIKTETAVLDIPEIVKGYSLSGANIQNVVHFAMIRATTRQADPDAPLLIYLEDVKKGIKRELSKNGIPLNNKRHPSWDNPQRD